jgi:acyl carrier protein
MTTHTQDTSDTLAALGEVIEEVGGTAAVDVRPEMRLVEDLEIDSLAMIEMATATEEKFGLMIPDDEIKNLTTVQDVVDVIDRLRQRQ